MLQNLNPKQQQAVISETKRLLVLAGAGSGKTKTLIQKILFLISEKEAKPSSILAITFTKNAANEMIDRLIIAGGNSDDYEKLINNKHVFAEVKEEERRKRIQSKPWLSNLTVRTFHSLCYKILKSSGGATFDNQFRLLIDDRSEEVREGEHNAIAPEIPFDIYHKLLLQLCKDPEYLLKLKRYILDYYIDKIHLDKSIKNKSYPDELQYTTLKGEKVRSKSERDIADWLFRHNLHYQYEPQINLQDFTFSPDFYIPAADMFLEHVTDKSYSMIDKEQQFDAGGRFYVKTYEAMCKDSTLFNLSLDRIIKGRISNTISEPTVLKYEEEFATYQDKIKDFIRMVGRVHSMIKAEDLPLSGLTERFENHQHERVRVFYELAVPLMEQFNKYCTNKSYLDFDDLIIQSIKLLKENPELKAGYNEKFKYILVDEFQDVNSLQVKLLDLLLTPETQLFCVGDDWQSIYGFRGSEVSYIVDFEKHYKGSEVVTLNLNYRSTQNIVGASTEVIRKNKYQIDKEISAFKQTPSKIQIYRAKDTREDGVQYFIDRVRSLQAEGITHEEILVLYRRTKMYDPYRLALKNENLKVTGRTIHAAKGLEAKVVFILGLTEGSGGFPDIWLDDAVFRVIKDVKRDMLMEEERRLFYVALTRAKDELYLLTQIGNESDFISEIPKEFYSVNKTEFRNIIEPLPLCSSCKTLVKESYRFCPTCGIGL